jgi:hypothetical protein
LRPRCHLLRNYSRPDNRTNLHRIFYRLSSSVFRTQSPTLLAIGWGIIATWWVGVFFAIPLILAARAGSRPALRASALIPSIGLLLVFMACSAVVFGLTGYVLARSGIVPSDWLSFSPYPAKRYRFMADWWAHSASYASAFVGGVVLCLMTYRRRLQMGSMGIGTAEGGTSPGRCNSRPRKVEAVYSED